MKKTYLLLSIIFTFIFIFASCDGKNAKAPIDSDDPSASSDIYIIIDGEQKKIVNYNYKFTTKDVISLVNEMKAKANELLGKVADESVRDDYSKISYKIPTDNAQSFEKYLDENLSDYLKYKEIESKDVTAYYSDITSIIETYESRITYYENLVENPNTTAEERVTYNDKIDELKAEILSYNKKKDIIDNSTSCATFVVYVTEKTKPISTSERISDTLTYVVRRLIVITPICIIACTCYVVVVFTNKKKNKDNNNINNDNQSNNKE